MKESHLTRAPKDEQASMWWLCYGRYFYASLLAAHSRGTASRIVATAALDETSKRSDLDTALLPALLASGEIALIRGRYSRGVRKRFDLNGTWLPMVERHLKQDHQFISLEKLGAVSPKKKQRRFWREVYSSAKRARTFLLSIHAHTILCATKIAAGFAKCKHRTILDVGSGLGTVAIEILKSSKTARATLIDLPECITLARTLPLGGDRSRLTLLAFDILRKPWPKQHDVILLSNLLHDYPARVRHEILRRAARSAGKDAEIWIHDLFYDTGSRVPPAIAGFSYYLHCMLGGCVLSANAQIEEAKRVGLTLKEIRRTAGYHYLLRFIKA